MSNTNKQIKTKDRVRSLGEVYTNEREVKAMLDLVKKESFKISSRFLEPSCGNGNFLEEILSRKLQTVKEKYKNQKEFEYNTIKALTSVYGIDISEENIVEARERLKSYIISFYSKNRNTNQANQGFYDSIDYILQKNIFKGDSLNGQNNIFFSEFTNKKIDKKYYLTENIYRYIDILNGHETPIKTYISKLYLNLNLNKEE